MLVYVTVAGWVIGCGPALTSTNNQDTDFEEEVDDVAPVIVHEPISGAVPFGTDVEIAATVTDEGSGLLFVTLEYKNKTDGEADWRSYGMTDTGDGLYTGMISGGEHTDSGMDYKITAIDKAENEAVSGPYTFPLN